MLRKGVERAFVCLYVFLGGPPSMCLLNFLVSIQSCIFTWKKFPLQLGILDGQGPGEGLGPGLTVWKISACWQKFWWNYCTLGGHHWCCISTRSHCHHGRCIRKDVCLHLEPSSGNSLVLSCQGKDFMLRIYISLGVTGVPAARSLLLKLWGESFSKKGEWTAAHNLTGYMFLCLKARWECL